MTDPTDGKTRPARVMYFFPIASYIKSLFARPDLVRYLYHDTDDARPQSHVVHSRGFKEKVLDNPAINSDHRNLGLIGTTDGVPLFSDQKRGAWPFIQRCANLPDTLSMHMSNVHLHILAPSEYWEVDKDAGVLRRRVRAPKSLMPHLSVLVDDLLHAYHQGLHCNAHTNVYLNV